MDPCMQIAAGVNRVHVCGMGELVGVREKTAAVGGGVHPMLPLRTYNLVCIAHTCGHLLQLLLACPRDRRVIGSRPAGSTAGQARSGKWHHAASTQAESLRACLAGRAAKNPPEPLPTHRLSRLPCPPPYMLGLNPDPTHACPLIYTLPLV